MRVALLALSLAFAVPDDGQDDERRAEHFEARIRPVLIERCYACHNSSGTARGGVSLDAREPTRAVVEPRDPAGSLLLDAIRHTGGIEMPEGGPKLDDAVLADFERWIADGAYDPRDAPPSKTELDAVTSWAATLERRRDWWSLQPITNPVVPPATEWSSHPVDRFVERTMRAKGLEPSAPADARTLLRRLSFVTTGLPPTGAEIALYTEDERPGATERAIDRHLASERYGERWARHWMDVMRYADSHGSEGDPAIPHAYRYRDYLIRAFNQDVPYDQLVREHVAGDLLAEPRVDSELGIDESAIGAAHWRLVFHGFAPTDALDERVRFTDDAINVFSKAFLAQTISCARCHDHKFDAISQADYYALYGIVSSCRPAMRDVNTQERQTRHQRELARLKEQMREPLAAAWSEAVDALPERLAAPVPEGKALRLLREVDTRLASGATFADAWREAQASSKGAATNVHAWNLAEAREHKRWFARGNGLRGGATRAGAFALEPEGERVVAGVLPAGTYTHLLSRRHRGVIESPRFALPEEYEVWMLVRGGGEAMLRYVVQNYPRSGTVYPIEAIRANDWYWHHLDLTYWRGDDVHLELATAKDAPLQVRGQDLSWFGVRDVVVRQKGAGAPPSPDLEVDAAVLAQTKSGPATREELAGAYVRAARRAVKRWGQGQSSDVEARFLDALLRDGLLPNTLSALTELSKSIAEYRALEADVPLPTRVPGLAEADAFDQPVYVRGDPRQPGEAVPRRFLEVLDAEPYRTGSSGRLELAGDLLRADNPLTARVIVNRIWHHVFGRGLVATPDNFGRLGALPTHPELLDFLARRMVERGWSVRDTVRFLLTSKTWQQASVPSSAARDTDPENEWLSHAHVRKLDAEALRDALLSAAGVLDTSMYGPGAGANSNSRRRSVYVQSRRNAPDLFLLAFDAPVPFAPVGRRATTNVPEQALALMNAPFVMDLAREWGERAMHRGASDEERVGAMFARALGRPARAPELEVLVGYAREGTSAIEVARRRRDELEGEIAHRAGLLGGLLALGRSRVLASGFWDDAPPGPEPLARWDFANGLHDTVGDLHGTLHGSARLQDGLVLDGAGHVSTPPIGVELRAKTLEAWVQLETTDQRGGGVVTVQNLGGNVFDSIVFGERTPKRWLAGSDFFHRTQGFGGADETVATSEPVHVAIAYDADGTIRGYRNGEPYGAPYRRPGPVVYRARDSQLLFGLRHGAPSGGRMLRGRILEARLYDRALSAGEIAASADGAAYVARDVVLAALDGGERDRLLTLEKDLDGLRDELAALGPARESSVAWSRVAHALFNLKEFRYLR